MFVFVCLLLTILTLVGSQSLNPPKPSTPFWPQPQEILNLGNASVFLSSDFRFQDVSQSKSDRLSRAIDRYSNQINPQSSHSSSELNSCTILVTNPQSSEEEAQTLTLNVNEEYQLSVTTNGCSIVAENIWGALQGMLAFSQLLVKSGDGQIVIESVLPLEVHDWARFSHRGVLIDSSRHFLPISAIERTIDALSMNRFNVLHWHIVDAQSFPFVPPSKPSLGLLGAYSPESVYSSEQVRQIQSYALDRGVRLVVEIDIPGHSASWAKAAPEIMSQCFEKYSYNINDFALNPILEGTYDVVGGVLKDVVSAAYSLTPPSSNYPSQLLHLGGDEVVYGCWKNDSSILDYMAQHGLSSYDSLLSLFVSRVEAMAYELQTTPVFWEDVFKAGIRPKSSTVFSVWTNSDRISQVTQEGYRVIASPQNYWYLDIATNTWKVMYGYEPTANLTDSQASLVVGGETAMWAEQVDALNIDSKIWPTASAVAERLWSNKNVVDLTDAQARLLVHQCRLQNRGIGASPVMPSFCDKNYV